MNSGVWRANVQRLPTGGPYRIQFRLLGNKQQVVSEIELHNILVGDLWFLGGQSNMDGCGRLDERESPSMMVNAYTLADEWMIAEDPLNIASEGAYRIYRTSYGGPTVRNPVPYKSRDEHESEYGSGLGLSFAKAIYDQTRVPVGLIVGSLGGSAMLHWDPSAKNKGEDSLYWCMLKRIKEQAGEIKGVLWWQGESDSYAPKEYEQKLRRLIEALRSDLGRPGLPIYAVQLSHGSPGNSDEAMKPWHVIQDAQRRVMAELDHTGIVSTIDLPLQDAHLTTAAYKRVGRRLSKCVLHHEYGESQYQPGPRLKKISFFKSLHGDGVRLEFTGVNNRLLAPPRVAGFTLRRSDQTNEGLPIVRQEIDPDNPHAILLHLLFDLDDQPALDLWYGWGADAASNVVDEQDLALSMFGPIPLNQQP